MKTRTNDSSFSGNSHENGAKRFVSNILKPFVSQQPIKKTWSKLIESCQILCRAIGLNILVSSFKSFRHPWGKGFEETPKIAIRKSRAVALLRALVHLIPVGVALWEIILNWTTYYVGSYMLRQVYYQTAAKAHEIMIQASLATIVFSYIRHQMVLGVGIPFGALFSGLQINQIAYLWSIEFWGSLSSSYVSVRKRIIMLFFISICFILAAVSGPSSAVLLIPRLSNWPAGSTHIWVNATFDDIWPSRMKGSLVPPHCAIVEVGSLSSECPSSEWTFLQTWLSLYTHPYPESFMDQSSFLKSTAYQSSPVQLLGKSSPRQYLHINYTFRTKFYTALASISSTQQSVIADALRSTATMWQWAISSSTQTTHHGATLNDQQDTVHSIVNDYFQPYTSTLCLPDVIEGPNDRKNMAFPISPIFYERKTELPPNITASISGYPAVEFPSIQRAQLLEIPGRESDNRVKWVQLSQSPLTHASVGLIVLLPKDTQAESREKQTSTDIVVCNIQAGWGGSLMNMTIAEKANSGIWSLPKVDTSIGYDHNSSAAELESFLTTNDPIYFNEEPTYLSRPIEIDVEWAEYLNPFVPSINTTVIDFLLKSVGKNESVSLAPHVVSREIVTGLVTNGLARSGFTSELQGNISFTGVTNDGNGNSTQLLDGNLWVSGKRDFFAVDPEESKDWVKLRVDSRIQGYAYNIDGSAPKLAIAFLLTYCCLALGHCIYNGVSGISSSCWDTISEVTALAMNSPPTTVLRNTCAGITEIRIFRTPVRLLTMRDSEGEGEHLEMVFGDIEDEESLKRAIKPNRKYGTMPAATKQISLADKLVKHE